MVTQYIDCAPWNRLQPPGSVKLEYGDGQKLPTSVNVPPRVCRTLIKNRVHYRFIFFFIFFLSPLSILLFNAFPLLNIQPPSPRVVPLPFPSAKNIGHPSESDDSEGCQPPLE